MGDLTSGVSKLESALARLRRIVDEAFGMQPFMHPEELLTTLEREIQKWNAREREVLARAEKAERERDEAKDSLKAQAREIAKLDSLVAQVRDERDEARASLKNVAQVYGGACKSCEGPLTCSKCTSGAGNANAAKDRKPLATPPEDFFPPTPYLADHEARIKALEAKVDGIRRAPFGPRFAGHCSDCGIGPTGAHLAGCSKAGR